MGMDSSIFRPLQKRDDTNANVAALLGSLTSVDSVLRKRQQEVDTILEALAQNNPEDAAAIKKSLNKRQDDSVSDEAASLLEAETTVQANTEASKASLDADVLAANGLNSDFTKNGPSDTNDAQTQPDTASSETDSTNAQSDLTDTEDDSGDAEKRNVGDLRRAKTTNVAKRQGEAILFDYP
jgi:hypothetical protein